MTTPEPPHRSVVIDKSGDAWQRHGDEWVSTKPHDDERRRTWAQLCTYGPLLPLPDMRHVARLWRARRDLGPHSDPRYRPNQRVGVELAEVLDRIAGADG